MPYTEPRPVFIVTIEREPGWWVASWTETGQALGRYRSFDEAIPRAKNELAVLIGLPIEDFDSERV